MMDLTVDFLSKQPKNATSQRNPEIVNFITKMEATPD